MQEKPVIFGGFAEALLEVLSRGLGKEVRKMAAICGVMYALVNQSLLRRPVSSDSEAQA